MTPIRVFVCDDAPAFRDLLRMALEMDGSLAVVGEAEDGSGLDALAEAAPDVVLLDLNMPELGGLDALPRLRELAPQARVVVLSSFSAEEKEAAALAAGADRYVDKRASFSDIRTVVREVGRRRGLPSAQRTIASVLAGETSATAPASSVSIAALVTGARTPVTV